MPALRVFTYGLFAISGILGAQAAVVKRADDIGKVTWGPCDVLNPLNGTECGSIIVPLDYFNASAGTAKIALARYKATKLPKKGMVLWNPGGPGGAAAARTATSGDSIRAPIGDDYDLVGFDPRGIGQSEPVSKCFTGAVNYTTSIQGTTLERGYDIASNASIADLRPGLLAQQDEADKLLREQAAMCEKTMGQTIAYMGTSSVVRDLDLITTALEGEDALINFWGFSYGTVMGQYLVNMFPDRVGRVIIDGVVDAEAWVSQPYYTWYHSWMANVTDAYNIFLQQCSQAGSPSCALVTEAGQDPTLLADRIETYINGLYYYPAGNLTAGRMRDFIMSRLPYPKRWPETAIAIADALSGNVSTVLGLLGPSTLDMERRAVSCNDNNPFSPPSSETIVDTWLKNFQEITHFAFSFPINEPDAGCQYWPVTPPERYQGPWNKTLRNPILIISNTADPATPMVSGKTVAARMGDNARILIQDGAGHCSSALPSHCTTNAILAFFANGTLPAPGTVCPVDSGAFPSQQDHIEAQKTLFAPSGSASSSHKDREMVMAEAIGGRLLNPAF